MSPIDPKPGPDELQRIAWLLTRSPAPAGKPYESPYGDLTCLNTEGLILKSVGQAMLTDIVYDYLDMLETSAAVYEKNGDYALGLFSSGWCRFMDAASRRLCATPDNPAALASGRWHCHESCWTTASKAAMESQSPQDIECLGGLHIYAIPIMAGQETVGAINLGYGDPPRDPHILAELAKHYGVGFEELQKQAESYESRPPFIIEAAKKRLTTSARLIGEIIERRQAEEALRQSEKQIQSIFRSAPTGIGVVVNRIIRQANPRLCDMTGYPESELLGRSARMLYSSEEEYDHVGREKYAQIRDQGTGTVETRWIRQDGTLIDVLLSSTPIDPGDLTQGVTFTALDITDRKVAEAEQEKLQAQLSQAHKMESVGRLAGGVAHDFNNMLGVILGHTEMTLSRVTPGTPIHGDLCEIQKAAERSAVLTRQLLAFARKQTVAPRVLHLNSAVEGMLTMLRRLIGEDINLTWLPGRDLGSVRMDPSQLDQIMANLCVNARDAIADTGRVTIETENVSFDEAYCANHVGFIPGNYTLIAVSDDGRGMDHETLSHIFEPFYTTKDTGKGTGLGLATVYGIVRQNRGFINVYSEPDHGSRFTIYLPRVLDLPAESPIRSPQKPPPTDATGRETVLLVEDEPAILKMTTLMLEALGYTVLPAATPGECLSLAAAHSTPVSLLLTDVVMPEMNGRDLAQRIQKIIPGIQCLFLSGYTANVIAHHGVLDPGVHFIQKPFSMKALAAKLREVLDHEA